MEEKVFCAEYSKNDVSTCNKCKKKILTGLLRIAILIKVILFILDQKKFSKFFFNFKGHQTQKVFLLSLNKVVWLIKV
jgi:hypothetical protein